MNESLTSLNEVAVLNGYIDWDDAARLASPDRLKSMRLHAATLDKMHPERVVDPVDEVCEALLDAWIGRRGHRRESYPEDFFRFKAEYKRLHPTRADLTDDQWRECVEAAILSWTGCSFIYAAFRDDLESAFAAFLARRAEFMKGEE